jgi:hypothetical protein
MTLTLTLLKGTFTIHKLEPDSEIPADVLNHPFSSITRTDNELSMVLPESAEIESNKSDVNWACFKVEGPLDFGLVGILAGISSVLTEAGVPIVALSTFDTDYILVKREQVEAAQEALVSAGYQVHKGE